MKNFCKLIKKNSYQKFEILKGTGVNVDEESGCVSLVGFISLEGVVYADNLFDSRIGFRIKCLNVGLIWSQSRKRNQILSRKFSQRRNRCGNLLLNRNFSQRRNRRLQQVEKQINRPSKLKS